MKTIKSMQDVWHMIDSNVKVYWANESYQVLVTNDPCPEKRLSSNRGNQMLRVTCLSNWFGSRLEESELPALFIKKQPCCSGGEPGPWHEETCHLYVPF